MTPIKQAFPDVQSFAREDGKTPIAVLWARRVPSENDIRGAHWSALRAIKRRLYTSLLATAKGDLSKLRKERVKRRVVFVRGLGGRAKELDEDNFIGGLKPVLDCLKPEKLGKNKQGKLTVIPGLGLIKDDSRQWVETEHFQNKTEVPGWVRVEIWEI